LGVRRYYNAGGRKGQRPALEQRRRDERHANGLKARVASYPAEGIQVVANGK
jgi:hypothetical protein